MTNTLEYRTEHLPTEGIIEDNIKTFCAMPLWGYAPSDGAKILILNRSSRMDLAV